MGDHDLKIIWVLTTCLFNQARLEFLRIFLIFVCETKFHVVWSSLETSVWLA